MHTRGARQWTACLAGVLVLACVAATACRPRTVTPAAAPESETGRFPHTAHADVACTDCHDADAVRAGRPARPGVRDHAPCDQSGCHREAFLTVPGPLCAICHAPAEPAPAKTGTAEPGPASGLAGALVGALVPYPPTRGRRALASTFSHARHLSHGQIEARMGFHVSCTDCHLAQGPDEGARAGQMAIPGHGVCGRCHAPEAAPPEVPVMDQCTACHQERTRQPLRQRRFITSELRFTHGNHRVDRGGQPILCTECHTRSAGAEAVGSMHPTPETRACVQCHDDTERTPAAMRMRVCETCHTTRALTIGILAPRSHLPARERPQDHTLAFRRDHATEAGAAATRCARCHTFMSGSPRAVCDECHQVMRPRDHTLTWRELDHGPAAATRADRCSTCHTVPFCVACHQRPPRSHFPSDLFRDGGHAVPASINLRACITCHGEPARGCTGAGPGMRCHRVAPGGRP